MEQSLLLSHYFKGDTTHTAYPQAGHDRRTMAILTTVGTHTPQPWKNVILCIRPASTQVTFIVLHRTISLEAGRNEYTLYFI